MGCEVDCAAELQQALYFLGEGNHQSALSSIRQFRDCYLNSNSCVCRGEKCDVLGIIENLEKLEETKPLEAGPQGEEAEPECTDIMQIALHHLRYGQPGIGLAIIEPYRDCKNRNESCPFKGEDCAMEEVINGLTQMRHA